jgi:signal transduction histidine kinase/CheY-like chemotaxis protein
MYNKTLEGQVKALYGNPETLPEAILPLLNEISRTYDNLEKLRWDGQSDIINKVKELSAIVFSEEETNSIENVIVDDLMAGFEILQLEIEKRCEVEKGLYAIFENLHDSIWSVNNKYELTTYNSCFKDTLLFYTGKSDLQSVNYLDYLSGASKDNWKNYYDRALSGERFRIEDSHYINDQILAYEISFNPIFHKGMINGVSCFAQNISQRKKAELETINAKNEAIASAGAKSDFLATMSHEIRTPLNGIIGMTGLLVDTRLTKEQKEFIETIRISGDTLLTLINDILDFSRIESGKLQFEESEFELRNCIEEAFDLLAPRALEKNIELLYFVKPGVPSSVTGDITRIRQILVNLISNAIKFTAEGEVFVSVSGSKAEENVVLLSFSVKDTGIGIAPENISKLFKSFSQVDSSTTRKYGGTGLGLAICKKLVELMNGSISVVSTENEGSEFNFTIKVKTAEQSIKGYNKMDHSEFSGKKILIVDDNLNHLDVLDVQLRQWGMEPSFTASPQEAVSWIKDNRKFDAAVIDMSMPLMDGIELGKEIRKYKSKQELPAVLLANSIKKDSSDIINDIFNGYAAKPLKHILLYEQLKKLFVENGHAIIPDKVKTDHDIASTYPLHILVAEDNTINQKLILRFLSKFGYIADTVGNGVEVLQILRHKKYDIILMDIQMPEMDGLTATEHILEEYKPDYQPVVIAMTANAMPGDKEICFASGMRDYMSKPISIETVKSVLLNWGEKIHNKSNGGELMKPEANIIDYNAVDTLNTLDDNGGPEFLNMMIELFLKDTPVIVESIRSNTAEKNFTGLATAAHSLKGICLNIGAKSLGDLCLKFELKGRNGDLRHLDEMLITLDDIYSETCSELKKLVR